MTGPVLKGKPLKVMTIVGTRPEVIKLSRVIAALDRHTDHVLVHSGQNYDPQLNEVFFRELAISRPRHFLGVAEQSVARDHRPGDREERRGARDRGSGRSAALR